jgi:uncharacterized protein (DUF2249 family)
LASTAKENEGGRPERERHPEILQTIQEMNMGKQAEL